MILYRCVIFEFNNQPLYIAGKTIPNEGYGGLPYNYFKDSLKTLYHYLSLHLQPLVLFLNLVGFLLLKIKTTYYARH